VVHESQKKGCPLLGLTVRNWDFSLFTLEQLASVHISFQPTLANKKMLFSNDILFRDGILFTTGFHKGKALLSFLQEISFIPKRIVMIDDSMKHLQNVEEVLQEKHIPFLGLHYRFPEGKVKRFSPAIADMEWKYMRKILSDDQAKAYLEKDLQSK
ncbi:MAG: DUF2608 domain-containing protein, partial [Chlamydiota bacterium]